DAARDLPRPPVRVEAVGTQIIERLEWDQSTLTHEPQVLGQAAHLWTRTSLGPGDVGVAELYDGYTFNCLSWIEALGFCGIGEARDFLDGGKNIARDGLLPLNTHGGQLSHGRTHGMGLVHEAIVQLRGEGGERQVPGARVAVVSSGGLTPSGVLLLRTDAGREPAATFSPPASWTPTASRCRRGWPRFRTPGRSSSRCTAARSRPRTSTRRASRGIHCCGPARRSGSRSSPSTGRDTAAPPRTRTR